jgi:hypothetical protein
VRGSEADDQDPVSLRYELPGFRERDLHGFGLRLYQVRQPRVSVARSGQRPVLAREDPRDVFGDQRQTVWTFFSVLIGISPFPPDRIALDPIACVVSLPVGTSCSSAELDQVLKDQLTPAISARLRKQSTFRKLSGSATRSMVPSLQFLQSALQRL